MKTLILLVCLLFGSFSFAGLPKKQLNSIGYIFTKHEDKRFINLYIYNVEDFAVQCLLEIQGVDGKMPIVILNHRISKPIEIERGNIFSYKCYKQPIV